MPISLNPSGATADLSNPLNIPVYNEDGTAYIPVNFYTWGSPFHTSPIGLDGTRPDSYFTGLTAPVFSDDIHKYTAPISWARCPRESDSYKATFNNYSVATYGTNVVRNYILTGLTGGFGESSVADWTNQLTGNREENLGKIFAWTIEIHTRYYNHRGMTGYYIPAIMLLDMFRPYAEYSSSSIDSALSTGAMTSGGPTASWLSVFHHPNDRLSMSGGTYGMATGDIARIQNSGIFCEAGLSGAIYGFGQICASMKAELDRRSAFTPGLTYPKYMVNDLEYEPFSQVSPVAEQTYTSTVTLSLTGVTAGSFTGYSIYTTPVWPFVPGTGSIDGTRSNPLAIRKYTYFGGQTGELQVVKLSTGTSSTWAGKTGYVGLTSSFGTHEIVSASSAVNYTRNPAANDTVYSNMSAPYFFVKIPSDATGNLGAALPGKTHDAGMWPQLFNDPKALTYQFFDKITLYDLWGRTGPFNHDTTGGCNYSPNQFRPSQYISAAIPSNDSNSPGGITLAVANVRYTAHDPGQSSEDINPTFKNWYNSFITAHTYWMMGKVLGASKAYFPDIKLLGEYDFMMGSKQYPCNRGKIIANSYELDLMSGTTGSSYAANDAVDVFPTNLDGVSPLIGFNYFSATNLNREAQQFYGLASSSSQPHEVSSLKSGWVGYGFGPSAAAGTGLTSADGWFDKKTYRTFLEKCYQSGITGVSGGFNLTGTYSVNTGITGYNTPLGDSFLNQQDMIRARFAYNMKQVQSIWSNAFYFDELAGRTFYIAPWFTEPETDGIGSPTGANYTLSSTTPPQKPWPRNEIQISTSYPLFQMLDQAGTARGATAMLHRPSQYDYFSFIRKAVWEYGAGPFFIFDARGVIHKPAYTENGVAGATGISGAIKMFISNDIYSHVPTDTYQPEFNFVGTTDSYGKSPVYATFTSNVQSGASPLTVVFDASDSWIPSGTATWYFNGTTTGPSSQGLTASYQYVGAGTYNVRLDIQNAYDSDTLTRTNYIVVSSEGVTGTANVEGSPASGTAPLVVTFVDASTIDPTDYATTYRSVVIDFGDGATASMLSGQTLVSLTHAYQSEGDYTVNYQMTWSSGLTSYITKSNYISVIEGGSTGPTGGTGGTGGIEQVSAGSSNTLNYHHINNPRRVRNGKIITNFGRYDIIR